jgi:hypothetical protein
MKCRSILFKFICLSGFVVFAPRDVLANGKDIPNIDDCRQLLSHIPGKNPLEAMRRKLVAFIAAALSDEGGADMVSPVVHRTEALGVTAIGSAIYVAFRAQFTEPLARKNKREQVFLIKYDTESQDFSIAKPQSFIDRNGSIDSSIVKSLVPGLAVLQVSAIFDTEHLAPYIKNPHITAMDHFSYDDSDSILRITVGSLNNANKATRTSIAPIKWIRKYRKFDLSQSGLIIEQTTNLPRQPLPLQKRTKAEKLVYQAKQPFEDNVKRAVLVKIGDDEIHSDDKNPPLEIVGQFDGKLGDKIVLVQAQVLLDKDDNPLTLYYTVTVNADGKMAVQRDLRYDEDGDKSRGHEFYIMQTAERHILRKIEIAAQLMTNNFTLGADYQRGAEAIGYVRNAPLVAREGQDGGESTENLPEYYLLIRGGLKVVGARNPDMKKSEFIGVVEMRGGMPVKKAMGLLLFPKLGK